MQKSVADFDASLEVLRANIALFHSGTRSTYRVVATELRKLLCDKNALVPRLFRDFTPHKLFLAGFLEGLPEGAGDVVMNLPLAVEFDGKGGHRSQLNFASPPQRMDLKPWLDQPFMSSRISVREFIKSVADKEGAHSDPEFNATLAFSHSMHLAADPSTGNAIIAIAEYVLEYLDHEPLKRNW